MFKKVTRIGTQTSEGRIHVCTVLKYLTLVFRAPVKVLMITCNYRVFTCSPVVYVEQGSIPVRNLSVYYCYELHKLRTCDHDWE